MKVGDRVEILGKNGSIIGEGTIYNINEFREPSMIYAVDVDGYGDVLFFGESQLRVKEWGDNIRKTVGNLVAEYKFVENGVNPYVFSLGVVKWQEKWLMI